MTDTFNKTLQFNVSIEYCGGWGYGTHFNFVKGKINEVYPEANVEGFAVPGNSGCFEVKVEGEELIFSKLGGAGYPTADKIPALLASLKKEVEESN